MNENGYIKRIESYLTGQLSEAERQQFEADLNSDQELAEQLRQYELARQAVDLLSREELKASFRQWRSDTNLVAEKSPQNIRPLNRDWLKIIWKKPLYRLATTAAIILLLLATWLLIDSRMPYPERTARNYLPPPALSLFKSGDSGLNQAVLAFEAEEYETVITQLQSTTPLSERALLLLAHAHFQMGDYAAAAQQFREFSQADDTVFREEAEWGLLLSLLAGKQTGDEFNFLLNRISTTPGSSFQKSALELKRHLIRKGIIGSGNE